MSTPWTIFDSFNIMSEEAKRTHHERVCNSNKEFKLRNSLHSGGSRVGKPKKLGKPTKCIDKANLLKLKR